MEAFFHTESHNESSAEAASYDPAPELAFGPDEYLEHLRRVKEALSIPVMASLNGSTAGGWTSYARLLEQAGADAVAVISAVCAADDPEAATRRLLERLEPARAARRGPEVR